MMDLYPLPNLPGEVNNFLYNPVQTNRVDQFNIRSDYRTNRSAIFGRVSYEDADTFNPGNLPEPAIGAGPGRPGQVVVPSKQAVFGYGRSLGPTKYYYLHVGYSRMFQGIYDSGTKYGAIAEQLGILNANAGGAAPGLSTTSITGMTGLGDGAGSLQKVNNNWEIDQAFSWVRSRHELKFGFDYMSRRFAFHSPGAPSGLFTFSGVYTGFGLADFLFGHPTNSRYDATKCFTVQRDAADHERRCQFRRREADFGRLLRRPAATVADSGNRLLLLAAGRQDLHHVRVERKRAARTGVEHGGFHGLCRRQRDLRGSG